MANRFAQKYTQSPSDPYVIEGPPDPQEPLETRRLEQQVAEGGVTAQTAPFRVREAQASATKAEAEARAATAGAPDPDAERKKLWGARHRGRVALETLGQMRGKLNDKSTGLVGQGLSFIGGTDATDLNALADTLRANLSFEELQKMRDNSKTGGALGSITERELELLSSTVGSLDTKQSKEQLAQQISKVERHYKRALLALEGIDPDSYKFDPFVVLPAEEARAQAQQMIKAGASEKDVSEFLRLQDHTFDPKQLREATRQGRGRVVQGQGEVGPGILKGLEHVGSRGAEAVQDTLNTATGTDFTFADDWRKSIGQRYGYVDPSGEQFGRVLGAGGLAALTRNPFMGGAIGNTLMSDTRDAQGLVGEGIWGGIAGVAGDKLIRGIAGLASPQLSPSVRSLDNAGVRMTPGQLHGGAAQRAEGLRTSLPFAGQRIANAQDQSIADSQHALQDQVLGNIGQRANRSIPPGRQGVKDVRERVDAEYDEVLSQTDYQWSTGTGNRILTTLSKRKLRPDVAKEVADTIQYEVGNAFANGSRVTGREWKTLDESLSGVIEGYRKQGGPMRKAAEAVRDIKKTLYLDYVRQNPKLAPRIRKADRAWRQYRTLKRASLANKGQGIATGQQVLGASRAEDAFGKTAFSEGRAPLQSFATDMENVLPSQFVNSRTTDRSIAAAPTRESIMAHAQGLALSPMYTEPFMRAYQRVMTAPRPDLATFAGNALRRVPSGTRGMFGGMTGDRLLYGDDGPYDPVPFAPNW